jgi:hypothetical protein
MKATPRTAMRASIFKDLKKAVDNELVKKPDLPPDYVEALDNVGIELELLLSFLADHKEWDMAEMRIYLARPPEGKCFGMIATNEWKAFDMLKSFAKRNRAERVIPYVDPDEYTFEELHMIEG